MSNRRKFLKNSLLGSLGLGLAPVSSTANNSTTSENTPLSINDKFDEPTVGKKTISLLQTTDVHCQVHSHDELFWENNQIVFRKTAGYAQLATLFKNARKKKSGYLHN
jgi:S-sulfosulfanyl-L-cysteine sulfohydrolase